MVRSTEGYMNCRRYKIPETPRASSYSVRSARSARSQNAWLCKPAVAEQEIPRLAPHHIPYPFHSTSTIILSNRISTSYTQGHNLVSMPCMWKILKPGLCYREALEPLSCAMTLANLSRSPRCIWTVARRHITLAENQQGLRWRDSCRILPLSLSWPHFFADPGETWNSTATANAEVVACWSRSQINMSSNLPSSEKPSCVMMDGAVRTRSFTSNIG